MVLSLKVLEGLVVTPELCNEVIRIHIIHAPGKPSYLSTYPAVSRMREVMVEETIMTDPSTYRGQRPTVWEHLES